MTETGLQPEALDLDPAPVAPERDLMSKFDGLIAEREALVRSGVRNPFTIVMDEVKSPTEAVIRGKDASLRTARGVEITLIDLPTATPTARAKSRLSQPFGTPSSGSMIDGAAGVSASASRSAVRSSTYNSDTRVPAGGIGRKPVLAALKTSSSS